MKNCNRPFKAESILVLGKLLIKKEMNLDYVDTVVIAVGSRPVNILAEKLKDKVEEIKTVGVQ